MPPRCVGSALLFVLMVIARTNGRSLNAQDNATDTIQHRLSLILEINHCLYRFGDAVGCFHNTVMTDCPSPSAYMDKICGRRSTIEKGKEEVKIMIS